ncbi:protein FAM107B-like isoform X2 [Syngnathoides biaculeatus]|uniref:protein FAM107B-like isoform X2 n=1 Tax=Syngnathoides biaculeatus TaxID=300417 RepID=UPI002ADD7B96|nr:protein FAM107B-like isoform X2 [Syngnathoides biaculeatus]
MTFSKRLAPSPPAHACAPAPQPRRATPASPGDDPTERRRRDSDDLIKPRKLLNPVRTSRSHQELHRELMTSCKRSGVRVESSKPELERVLECRRRDRMIKERKQEEEARRKISPLEAELRKRHQALEELEAEQQRAERHKRSAPEFVKVKENLRRTSHAGRDEKQV